MDGFTNDKFVGVWTGLVYITEGGSYTFASSSNDGSALFFLIITLKPRVERYKSL